MAYVWVMYVTSVGRKQRRNVLHYVKYVQFNLTMEWSTSALAFGGRTFTHDGWKYLELVQEISPQECDPCTGMSIVSTGSTTFWRWLTREQNCQVDRRSTKSVNAPSNEQELGGRGRGARVIFSRIIRINLIRGWLEALVTLFTPFSRTIFCGKPYDVHRC